MQVARWGNSLAARIPVGVSRALALKEGDEVELRAAGDATFEVPKIDAAAEKARQFGALSVRLPTGWKLSREELYEPDFDRD